MIRCCQIDERIQGLPYEIAKGIRDSIPDRCELPLHFTIDPIYEFDSFVPGTSTSPESAPFSSAARLPSKSRLRK
jgi:hypothetical protein